MGQCLNVGDALLQQSRTVVEVDAFQLLEWKGLIDAFGEPSDHLAPVDLTQEREKGLRHDADEEGHDQDRFARHGCSCVDQPSKYDYHKDADCDRAVSLRAEITTCVAPQDEVDRVEVGAKKAKGDCVSLRY